jgi:hypothetical protein
MFLKKGIKSTLKKVGKGKVRIWVGERDWKKLFFLLLFLTSSKDRVWT